MWCAPPRGWAHSILEVILKYLIIGIIPNFFCWFMYAEVDFLVKRQQDWEDSFQNLYYMLRKNTCNIFYGIYLCLGDPPLIVFWTDFCFLAMISEISSLFLRLIMFIYIQYFLAVRADQTIATGCCVKKSFSAIIYILLFIILWEWEKLG